VVSRALDRVARVVEESLDMEELDRIIREPAEVEASR
jgi:hypothetical protein